MGGLKRGWINRKSLGATATRSSAAIARDSTDASRHHA